MPANVVDNEKDEKKWKKAKRLAKEQGHGGEYDYIMGIYKKMDPDGIEKEAYLGGVGRVLKVAGMSDAEKDRLTADLGAGVAGGALAGAGESGVLALINRMAEQQAAGLQGSDSRMMMDALEEQYGKDVRAGFSSLDDAQQTQLGNTALFRTLKNEDNPAIDIASKKSVDAAQFDPATKKIMIPEGEVAPPRTIAHELGHASDEGTNTLLRTLASRPRLARTLGVAGGLGAASSDNEAVQTAAPLAPVIADAPTLYEEARANRNAKNMLQKALSESGDGVMTHANPEEVLRKSKRLLNTDFGRYGGATAATAAAMATVPTIKDKIEAYLKNRSEG